MSKSIDDILRDMEIQKQSRVNEENQINLDREKRIKSQRDEWDRRNRMYESINIQNSISHSSAGIIKSSGPNPLWNTLFGGYTADNTTSDVLSLNNATLFNGATYTTGKVNNSYYFDGVDDHVFLGNNIHNNLHQGDWSLSLWMYKINSTNGAAYSTVYVGPNTKSYGALLSGGTTYTFSLWVGSSRQFDLTFGSPILSQWNHFVITRSSSNATYKSYLNGSLIQTLNSSINPTYLNGYSNRVTQGGRQFTTMAQFLNGMIDETYFFSSELTQSQVTELYNNGNGKQYPN